MPPHASRLTASILAALVILASPSLAAWPRNPHTGNVPLSNFASVQVFPRMFPDGAGGAFIAWHELRATYDLYAQRVSASGAVTWGGAGVAVCSATGDQANAALCSDGAGGVIIAWHDARGGGAFDIYVQRLNAAGVPQWTANGVAICTATGEQSDPRIVSDGAGGAIIVWPDSRTGPSTTDLYAQRVNAAGVPQWTANGVVVCNATFTQVLPVTASDGAGGAVVVWVDSRNGLDYDIYAQRLAPGGGTLWTGNGQAVCTAGSHQYDPCLIADGTGGFIVGWSDSRSAKYHIYAQRLTAGGASLWQQDGEAVSIATGDHDVPVMTSDGAGGAILAWRKFNGQYFDIYAQRMSASGAMQWAFGSVPIGVAPMDQFSPCITGDGSGGAIISWVDSRDGNFDLYAQRVSGSGVVRWGTDAKPVSLANQDQQYPAIVSDGAGGAILSWHDDRLGAGAHRVYAQRIDRFGELGNAEAAITSVRDTPNDQGGRVKVSWSASYLDVDPTYGITEYRLWRSAPQAAGSLLALEADAVTADSDEAAATGKRLVLPNAANTYAWELADTQPAAILPNYSLVTATTADSVAGSNPRTAFMVEALSGSSLQSPRWFSAPDSGYSVDNLPPATPSPFSGVAASGGQDLHWGENTEADLAGYRLYRGVIPDFVPGPATLRSEQAGAGYLDVTEYAYFYKLSAVDAHGNESGFALFQAQGTTDAGDGDLPATLQLSRPEPNPARTFARVEFSLPGDSHVSLAVYDAGGRKVRTLLRGGHAAGRTGATWDLRDDAGRGVPGGIYFVRLETSIGTLTRRVIAIR